MTPVKKNKPSKKVSLIYVRNIDKEANDMLDTLKRQSGFGKSNASNVMKASFKFLEMIGEIKNLKSQVQKLQQDNTRKDNVYHTIKTTVLSIIERDIKSSKAIQKEKESFYRELKKTGKKMPRSLSFGRSYNFMD